MSAQAPAIVFVPGFMQRGETWHAVAERVGERYRSICVDPATWTLEERVTEVQQAAPDRAALVGYSLGGRLVLRAALAEPERYAAVVLVGASAGIEDEAERGARREADEELASWIESQPIESVVDRWERQTVFADQTPDLVFSQRPGRLSHDPARLAQLLRTAGQGAMDPVWERLGDLPMPLLAVAGERDERYTEAARRLADVTPRGEVLLIPEAGHAPHLEAPHAVAALLRVFFDKHLGQG